MDRRYKQFRDDILRYMPKDRVYTDELRCFAWGTDAGFYRMVPQIVVRAADEDEVSKLLQTAAKHKLPVTFRAAGTSLSGQSISDSILIVAGKNWEKWSISADAETVTLQPGIVGSKVNDILKQYRRKFGPDPASIKSAMVGGIVMNNASGMSCGTHANSDRLLLSARIVFADGTILDTADTQSRNNFAESHPHIISRIAGLRDRVMANPDLVARIRHKYSIKNVTGLNILPFITFEDPIDIILHCLVGSEGTLAFISEVTMKTLPIAPLQADAMVYFDDIAEAARAVIALKSQNVSAVELLDKMQEIMPAENFPLNNSVISSLTERSLMDAIAVYIGAGELEKAEKLADEFIAETELSIALFSTEYKGNFISTDDLQRNLYYIYMVADVFEKNNQPELSKKYADMVNSYLE